MPWVVYDPKEKDYLCQEQYEQGGELWDTDRSKATTFLTEEEAQMAFDDIDVDECLSYVGPLWIEPPEPPRKRWEDMTFDEKMRQVEEDFEMTVAKRVQGKILRVSPTGRREPEGPALQNIPLRGGFVQRLSKQLRPAMVVHDEVLIDVPGDGNIELYMAAAMGLLGAPIPIDAHEIVEATWKEKKSNE